MKFHKEGNATLRYTAIISSMVVALVFLLSPYNTVLQAVLGVLIFLSFAMVLNFFRVPAKNIQINPELVLAPADGKVVVIEEVLENEYFKDRRLQVSIFMSPLNVHNNINPVSGTVTYFKYHAGKFLVAWHPKSSTDNERTTTVVRTKTNTEILFRQVAGALARRIVWYVSEGAPVQQGTEFGFIKFGSRIDLFLPVGTQLNVTLGQKTTGGETVVATLG